jgi:hypothetical protein
VRVIERALARPFSADHLRGQGTSIAD